MLESVVGSYGVVLGCSHTLLFVVVVLGCCVVLYVVVAVLGCSLMMQS